MSRQWGHGFHSGKKEGEHLGQLIGSGEWESELCRVSARLILIANALRLPVEWKGGRTEEWWKAYVSAAAQEIEEIASALPGTVCAVQEFADGSKDSVSSVDTKRSGS